jgi:chromate reductase
VRALREAIARADGLVIASPEYNYGMPGVLKNALDWASRPYGRSALIGKPVLTLTASPAFTGGVRAQQQLNETLLAISARLVLRPQTVIGAVHEKVRDGALAHPETLAFVTAAADHLLADIAGLSPYSAAA